MRAFADALDCVPMALAQNSGLSPIETLASIKSRQVKEKNTRLGVDCMQTGSSGEFVRFPDPFLRCLVEQFLHGICGVASRFSDLFKQSIALEMVSIKVPIPHKHRS